MLELLTARLCHELSGPIAAIDNGVELLSEDPAEEASALSSSDDPGFLRDVVALVSGSARRARTRLEFYRFAYEASGTGASAGAPPHELAQRFFEKTRIACNYGERIRALPPVWQRLACNLLPVAAEILPRGGRMEITEPPLSVEAVGEGAVLSPEAKAALSLATPVAELTSRTVQAYFVGLLAKGLGCRMIATVEPGRVRLTAMANR